MKNCHNNFGRVESVNQDGTINVRYRDGRTDKNKSQCLFTKYVHNRIKRSRVPNHIIVVEKSKTAEEYWEPTNVSAASILPGKFRERKIVSYK